MFDIFEGSGIGSMPDGNLCTNIPIPGKIMLVFTVTTCGVSSGIVFRLSNNVLCHICEDLRKDTSAMTVRARAHHES